MRKPYFFRRGDVKERGTVRINTVLRQEAPDNGSDAEDGDRNFGILSSF